MLNKIKEFFINRKQLRQDDRLYALECRMSESSLVIPYTNVNMRVYHIAYVSDVYIHTRENVLFKRCLIDKFPITDYVEIHDNIALLGFSKNKALVSNVRKIITLTKEIEDAKEIVSEELYNQSQKCKQEQITLDAYYKERIQYSMKQERDD